MPRSVKYGAVGLIAVLLLCVALPISSRLRSARSELVIHVDSLPWQTLVVESANLPAPIRFERGAGDIRVRPVVHGVYRIGLHLKDGRQIWSEFFHDDAGKRRRLDLTITASPAGYRFLQTANQTTVLFDGEARTEEASAAKPFRLNWI